MRFASRPRVAVALLSLVACSLLFFGACVDGVTPNCDGGVCDQGEASALPDANGDSGSTKSDADAASTPDGAPADAPADTLIPDAPLG